MEGRMIVKDSSVHLKPDPGDVEFANEKGMKLVQFHQLINAD